MADEKNSLSPAKARSAVRLSGEASERAVVASASPLRLLDLLPSVGAPEYLHHDKEIFSDRLAKLRSEASSGNSDSKAEEVLLAQVLNWIHPAE